MRKKFSKEYKDMMKQHKKKIMEYAKNASVDPFDWAPGLQVFVDHLYFMRDYYALGENVWACEIEEHPSREQCLNMIIAEYEAWNNCEDKYTKIFFKNEPDVDKKVESLLAQGYHLKEDKDPMFKDCIFLYLYEDHHENTEKMCKEYEYHRNRFFELVSEHLEYLWD